MSVKDVSRYNFLIEAFRYKLQHQDDPNLEKYGGAYYEIHNGQPGLFRQARRLFPQFYNRLFPETPEGNLSYAQELINKLDLHQDTQLAEYFNSETSPFMDAATGQKIDQAIEQAVQAPIPPAGRSSVSLPPPSIPAPTPQVPGFLKSTGKDLWSSAGVFSKRTFGKYWNFGNALTGAFSLIGGLVGGSITGSPLGVAAGAGIGGVGSLWVRSREGLRSMGNIGAGAINRTVHFSNQFSTQSLIKGPSKKWIIALIAGFFLLVGVGAAILPGGEQPTEASPISTPGRFVGVNIYSLTGKGERIAPMIEYLKSSCGVSLIRLFYESGPTEDLKNTLDLGEKQGIKFIVSLADFANRSPGNSLIPLHPGDEAQGIPAENPTAWYRDGYKGEYKKHVETIVNAFKNHHAVYAWELANEPHCAGFTDCVEAYINWVREMSQFITSIDSTHLVSIGTQANAEFQLGDSILDGQYEKINSFPSVTALTGHYYNGSKEAVFSGSQDFQNQKDLILQEINIAKKLNKPFYIGEAGFLCQGNNKECQLVQLDAQSLKDRAEFLRKELNDFFNAGATGYLIWQYSDRLDDPIETDPFSFFEGDPICQVLKEFSQKPTISPPVAITVCPTIGRISAPYGYNIPEYPDVANEGCGNLSRCHNGIDIAANLGTPVKVTFDGTVAFVGSDRFKGNYIEITDATGLIATFEHLQSYSVALNQTVTRGSVIGVVGQSGEGVTGPVLHYKLRRGGALLNPFLTLGDSVTLDPKVLISSDDINQNNYQNVAPKSGIENWGYCNL